MTIKTLTTAFTLLLTFFSTSAQDLDFVHSYGPLEEGTSHDRVNFAKLSDEHNEVLVGGVYTDELNLNIGSMNVSLVAEVDDIQGFLAIYSQNYDLLHKFNFGTVVSDAAMLTDSTFVAIGRYRGIHDFDPDPEDTLIVEGPASTDAFIGCYHIDGTRLWTSFFTSLYSVSIDDISLFEEQIIISGSNYADDLVFSSAGEEIALPNEDGTNSFIFSFDYSGEVVWYKVYDMAESSCIIRSLSVTDERLIVTLRPFDGQLNVSLTEEDHIISFDQNSNSFVGAYSLENLELENYSTLDVTQEDNFGWPFSTEGRTAFGWITTNSCRGENMILHSSSETDSLIVSALNDLDYEHFSCFDPNGLIKWTSNFPTSEYLTVADLSIDQFGYSYITGPYKGVLYNDEDEVLFEEGIAAGQNAFLMKLDPLGRVCWAYDIRSQQLQIEGTSVSVNNSQDLLITGEYTGNHDFDFSASTEYVGNFEDENGYLARYTQEPNEAEVFLNVPILHTEIEEAGATSLVYVSINREISEDVVVEATPDEQIDVGNGAGQPVELTFTPDGEKIMSLDVTAFDDTGVEGDHTGTITFTSSGETNFASLEDQTITFDIIDNDPDAVDEQTSDSQISVYPNPASDEITIDYPKNLSAKTIDLVRILDGNGRAVLEIKDLPKDQPVSVKELSRGSYILKVNAGGMEFSSKLVIQ